MLARVKVFSHFNTLTHDTFLTEPILKLSYWNCTCKFGSASRRHSFGAIVLANTCITGYIFVPAEDICEIRFMLDKGCNAHASICC